MADSPDTAAVPVAVAPAPAGATLREITNLPAPGGWPLVGNLLQFDTRSAHAQVEAWARHYGSMFRFRAGRRHLVVVTDHDVIGTWACSVASSTPRATPGGASARW